MSPALALPKAVIFDWDNTLVDSWPVIHHALNETLEAYGKPL
jgi:phosphoglycolate phosphatase